MDDDDFYGEPSKDDEYKIEQRSTERLLNDIKISGFRDGHQKLMENEVHLQLGFDLAYRCLARIAGMIGKLKAYSIYSNYTRGNTTFLAVLNQKLDLIEKYNYELFLNWDKNPNQTSEKVEPNAESMIELLPELERKLIVFEQKFFNLSTSDLKAVLNLSELDLTADMICRHKKYMNNDVELEMIEQAKVKGLNKMIDDFSFDF